MKQSTRDLGRVLPDRLRLLSRLIARKPPQYSPDHAKSVDDAFYLYTNTKRVNATLAVGTLLTKLDWPFPAFVDMDDDFKKSAREFFALLKWKLLAFPYILYRPSLTGIAIVSIIADADDESPPRAAFETAIVRLFRRHRRKVFDFLATSPILRERERIVRDVEQAFENQLWAATITTTVPLLDVAMRTFFGTQKLNVTVQVLRDAFIRIAGILPKDLMPASAVWDGRRDPSVGNAFAQSLEEDLRLPGIYLASFLEFADRYYEWHTVADSDPRTPLNRHAVMHCASEYWSEANAVRILTFLDLLIRLEKPLKILIHGEAAIEEVLGSRAPN